MLSLFWRCRICFPRVAGVQRHFIKPADKMPGLSVRCMPEEERINIILDYDHGTKTRTYRFDRLKSETLGRLIERVQNSIVTKSLKKNKKKQKMEEPESVRPEISVEMGGQIVNPNQAIVDIFVQGTVMKIGQQTFNVIYNPPTISKLRLPCKIMSGFLVIPKVESEFTDLSISEFVWYRGKTKAVYSKKVETVPEDSEFLVLEKVGQTFMYSPTVDDIGHQLLLKCVPKSGTLQGKMFEVLSDCEVTQGPGPFPFENRHLYTKTQTKENSLRVMTYNILADMYTDSNFARSELFPYCPGSALDYDYRMPMMLREITGYNSDVMCMQEVDKKVFQSMLQYALNGLGYQGIFSQKGKTTMDEKANEGEAIFFRTNKFRLVNENCIELRQYLQTDPLCKDILTKVGQSDIVLSNFCKRGTILQVAVLQRVDKPSHHLVVGNTHLFFHPPADNIRMIQALLCVRHLENTVQQLKQQGGTVSLIFCGDFNSRPQRGVNQYMVTGKVGHDLTDWLYEGTEHLKDMDFSHDLHLQSACGYPRYTNYIGTFHETLDYIFMDTDTLEVEQVIPPPTHEEVTANTAIPSVVFPSDHIAQVCDVRWKDSSNQ